MERPLFRTDLVSRPIDQGGDRLVEVTDPDSGTSFRFYEIEYAIACAMDGERDVRGLAQWARLELGLEPSPDELNTVISTLADLGYLEAPGVSSTGEVSLGTAPVVPERPRAGAAGSGVDVALGAPGRSPIGRAAGGDRIEAEDVELGFAGKSAAGPDRPEPPRADPFELGEAGNVGLPDPGAVDARAQTRPADDELSIHERETRQQAALSPDLSADFPVGTDDLKEAVRQSRVMQAVEPPAIEMEADEPDADADTTPPGGVVRPVAASGASAAKRNTPPPIPAQRPTGTQPVEGAPAGTRRNTPPPIVLPERPGAEAPAAAAAAAAASAASEVATASEAADTAVQPRRSSLLPVLVVLLILVAGAAAAYWWFVLRPQQNDAAAAPPPRPVATAPRPKTPPPPVEITATLEAGPSEEKVVNAPRAGAVDWVADSGSEVAEGAPVLKIDGYQRYEAELKESEESQRRYQEHLDRATSKGDKHAMRAAEANVKRKQGDIDEAKAGLAKFVATAPMGGVVEPQVKVKDNLKADQPAVKILSQRGPRASFTVPAGPSYAKGDSVNVTSRSDADLKASCTVESFAAPTLVVSCPTDSGLAPGTDVVLEKPKP